MKRAPFLIVLLSLLFFLSAWTPAPKKAIQVYIFLGEKCIISQYYTLTLRQLYTQYANETVQFTGVFPNPDASEKGVQTFKDKYQIPFELILDEQQLLVDKYQIKVTPEVLVTSNEQVIYQGRIDNTFFRVGKRRRITTTAELEEILQALQKENPIPIDKTEAIGCLITPVNPILRQAVMCKPTTSDPSTDKN